MKKNKGFTLIELLAIIVILAIIAVITVPIILNIIENASIGAVQDSAYGYKDAINKYYLTKLAQDKDFGMEDKTYSVSELKTAGVSVNGKEPTGNSWVTLENNNVTNGCLQFDEYKVDIENGQLSVAVKGECEEYPPIPGMVVNGVKYYDASWVKENAVQYNPGHVAEGNTPAIAPGKCTSGDDCKTWYPYSEFTQNGQKYVNMIMDRNTRNVANWAYKKDYMGIGDNPVSPAQDSTENTVGISYPEGKTSFATYDSDNKRNEKGPLTVLKLLHADTDLWNLPLRTDSYTPATNSYSNYTIDYSGYKARLISAEEIAFITRKNTESNSNAWGLNNAEFYFGSLNYTIYHYQSDEQKAIQNTYSWLFDYTLFCITQGGCETDLNDYIHGYWTSSPSTSSTDGAWCVDYNGRLTNKDVTATYSYIGVRPVITVLKSDVL